MQGGHWHRSFRRCLEMPKQVGEKYVFTVADSSPIDSFAIVVEESGHNALADFDGPAKVGESWATIGPILSCVVCRLDAVEERPPCSYLHAVGLSAFLCRCSRRLAHVAWNTRYVSTLLRMVSRRLALWSLDSASSDNSPYSFWCFP